LSLLLLTRPGVSCIVLSACLAGECARGIWASMRRKSNFWTHNINIPGHTKNKGQTRAYKVLCALITLSGVLTISVRMHEYATTFEFGHLTGRGCNQKYVDATKNIQDKEERARPQKRYHTSWHAQQVQWSKQLLRMFGPDVIDQLKSRAALFFFFLRPKFWKRNFSSASERAFHILADFFVAELPQKRGCFNTQEFTRFLSTCVVSASSHALWRVLSNKVIRVFFHCWVDISHKLFLTWMGVVRFVSHEGSSDKGFVIWHYLHWYF